MAAETYGTMNSTNDHTEPAHDDCSVESILELIQARNAERGPAPAPANDVRCGPETDPHRARAAFMADPAAALVVNGRRYFHRQRAEDRRRRRLPSRPVLRRRPACNTRRRGSGRPAGSAARRSSARSADSGSGEPGPSDDDGLGDRRPGAGVAA